MADQSSAAANAAPDIKPLADALTEALKSVLPQQPKPQEPKSPIDDLGPPTTKVFGRVCREFRIADGVLPFANAIFAKIIGFGDTFTPLSSALILAVAGDGQPEAIPGYNPPLESWNLDNNTPAIIVQHAGTVQDLLQANGVKPTAGPTSGSGG